MQGDIFISYSRKDIDAVKPIKADLKANGFRCWMMDIEGIESCTEDTAAYIVAVVERACAILFLISANSQKSLWLLNMLHVARQHNKHIFIVRFNDDNDDNMFATFLREFGDLNVVDWRRAGQRQKLKRDLERWISSCSVNELPFDPYTGEFLACRCYESKRHVPMGFVGAVAAPSLGIVSSVGCQCGIVSGWIKKKISDPNTEINAKEEQAPTVQLDQVDFSAIAPRAMKAGACSTIQIVMYEKDFRNEVDAIIKGAEGPVHETRSGQVMAPRGAKIRIVLLSQDIEIDDNVEEGNWSGGYRVFSFLVQLPVDFVKSQVRFAATVYIQDVVATKLKFMASCSGKGNSRPSVQRKDVNSAFISYASKDRPCVINAIQGMLKVRPDLDVFLDVAKLHSGEDWESRLYKEIDDRDVLYLFWSRHAKKSKWVGREWRYAFHTKGIEGIEPFPIESAEKCPPPKELSKLHFNDYLQCLAQGMASAHGS